MSEPKANSIGKFDKKQKAKRALYISIVGNFFLAILKWVIGFFGNSYALIADAIESLTDVFSSILLLIGINYAAKPADKNHPYGHGKAEPVATFAIVGFLLVSATVIAYTGIQNIQTPHAVPKVYTLYVLGGIIILKEILYRVVKVANKATKSTTLHADAWHHRSDAITSLAAFIGILLAILLGENYAAADDWAALIAAGIIVLNAYFIFRPALGEIMDEHTHHSLIEEIRNIAKQTDGVVATEKCFIRKTGMDFYVDLHLIVDGDLPVKTGHAIAHRLKAKIQKEKPDVVDVLIHVEPHE